MMNVTLTNVSVYCTASKRVLQWHIMTTGPSGTMFVEFFHEKYRLAMGKYIMVRAHNPPSFFFPLCALDNGSTCLPTLCAGT